MGKYGPSLIIFKVVTFQERDLDVIYIYAIYCEGK